MRIEIRKALGFLVLAGAVSLLGPGPARAYLKNLGYGAGAMGMGGAYTAAAEDVTAVIWNPASLAALDGAAELKFAHSEHFKGEIKAHFLGVNYFLDPVKSIALAVIHKEDTEFRYKETTLVQGFSMRVREPLYLGAIIREHMIESYDNGRASGFDFGVGLLYRPTVNLAVGVNWENLAQSVKDQALGIGPNEAAKTVTTVGLRYEATPRLALALDYRGWDTFNFGLRLQAGADTVVRAGFNDESATLGIGWNTRNWNLAHAIRADKDQRDPQSISVGYRWDRPDSNGPDPVAARSRVESRPDPGPPRRRDPRAAADPGRLGADWNYKAYSRPGRVILPNLEVEFTDIHGCWAKNDILALSQYDIFKGFPDGGFRPDEPLSPDQFERMVKRLHRLLAIEAFKVEIHFQLPVRSWLQIDIFDGDGRRIRSLMDRQLAAPGSGLVVWDGKSHTGEYAAPGRYLYMIEVEPADRDRPPVTLSGMINAAPASELFASFELREETRDFVPGDEPLTLARVNRILRSELKDFDELPIEDPSLAQRPVTRAEIAAILNRHLQVSRSVLLSRHASPEQSRINPFQDKSRAVEAVLALQADGVDGFIRQVGRGFDIAYVIQVGAFSDKHNAERFMINLEDRGFAASIQDPSTGDRVGTYRVVVAE